MKKPKIGSLVRLKRGDQDTLYLVAGHPDAHENLLLIKAVDELDCRGHMIDVSMVRQETVADDTHKKIIEEWIKTRTGRALANALL